MNKYFKLFLIFTITLFTVAFIQAQSTPTEVIDAVKNAESPTQLFTLTSVITALIMTFLGYLAPFVPFIKEIPSTTFQVFTVGVLTIVGGIMFGFVDVFQGAIAYLISTNLYTHVLKLLIKTPKSTASAVKK